MNKRRTEIWGPAILFFVLLSCSHLLLPHLNKINFGPLFDWQLFSGVNSGPSYDLRVKSGDKISLITENRPFYFDSGAGVLVWFLVQKLGRAAEPDPRRNPKQRKRLDLITLALTPFDLAPLRVCKIEVTLPEYLLFSPEHRSDNCDDLDWQI
jgi:hypothetical protein